MGSNQTMVNLEFRPLEDVPKSRETNGNGQGHVQNLTQCVKPSSEEISKSEGDAAYLPRKNTTITQNRNSSQVPDQSIDRREASGGLSAPPHQEGSTSEMSENFPNLPASSQNPLRIEQGKPTKEIFKEMGY